MPDTRGSFGARTLKVVILALAAAGVVVAAAYVTSSLVWAETPASGTMTSYLTRAARSAWRMSEDAATTAKVKAALAMSRSVEALDVDVDSRGGKVTLTGEVPSLAAEVAALRIARDTVGVTEVVDRLDAASESQSSLDELRAQLADAEILCGVYERFLRTPGLNAKGVHVVVRDRIVTLTGTFDDVLASRQAEAAAASVASVRTIVNRAAIMDARPPATTVPVPDEEVTLRVREELATTGAILLEGVEIVVRSGIVELRGSVRSEAERQLAELLAGSVEGTVAVVNELKVTSGVR